MNKKLLCCALVGALGLAQTAMAQDDLDDRWYVSGTVGYGLFDNDRSVSNDMFWGFGVGKFISERWSVDLQLDHANPNQKGTQLNWSLYSASLVSRYHFRDAGDNWWPYFAIGAGVQRHEDEYPNAAGGGPLDRRGNDLLAQVGAGLQADYGRTALRAEAGLRYDFDDTAGRPDRDDYFSDVYVGLTAMVKLGPEPVRAVTPAPAPDPVVPVAPVVTCADLDDDGDGVNNCDDKCPNSQAGQTVGPDGCPVPVTIDLRGVNFDFDKSSLRPDAVAILSEAVSILQKYPELRVEVAGHTDSIGTDAYNQGLSERRARAVYDYLTSNGIDASRLVGPNGYGENRPIDTNDTSDGRARNRRTELNVQN